MRIIIAGAATALLSFAAATPAYAQFGGSPDALVDGAPGTRTQAPAQDDEDDQAVAPEAGDGDEIAVQADGYGKPGADDDQGGAYADQGDADNDVDQAMRTTRSTRAMSTMMWTRAHQVSWPTSRSWPAFSRSQAEAAPFSS